jgi:hypothetical protein
MGGPGSGNRNAGGARHGAGRKPEAQSVRTSKPAVKLAQDGGALPLEGLIFSFRANFAKHPRTRRY